MVTFPKPPFPTHAPAEVNFPFWRILFGLDEPNSHMSAEDEMRELEALQISLQDRDLARYTDDRPEVEMLASQLDKTADFVSRLKKANISNELRSYLDSKAPKSP